MSTSAFLKYEEIAYPYRYKGRIEVATIAGGVPTDEKVAEGWIRSKIQDKEEVIREMIAQTMAERGVSAEEAAKMVDMTKHLNGFKRDPERGLYVEGRQLKAALKEAGSVAVGAGKLEKGRAWGTTNKGLLSFFSEHVFVVDDRLYLGVSEPTGIVQRFVSTFRGTGIQYMEYVENAVINFTVITDWEFKGEHWGMIWLTAQQLGLGASRSQGFGRFVITNWELEKK